MMMKTPPIYSNPYFCVCAAGRPGGRAAGLPKPPCVLVSLVVWSVVLDENGYENGYENGNGYENAKMEMKMGMEMETIRLTRNDST